jgi:murein DD-endopeptidase MepM/ murein hydrolase activator NlpD
MLLSAAAPLLLAGLLPTPDGAFERWCWSGAFVYPLGDPYRLLVAAPRGTPPFEITRGFSEPQGKRRHEGADFSNGRGGEVVRAAAHGLVVLAEPRDTADFGCRVVIAHRLPDGSLAYSVYAHLQPGSIQVREGERVWLAQPIARVGHSGNAHGDHLHFELRRPKDLEERWENTRAVDPLVFLAAWLPGHRADTSRAGRTLVWAEEASLIGPRDDGNQALTRAAWWEMMARVARHPAFELKSRPDSLRLELIDCSVLPTRAEWSAQEPARWKEVVRDVRRLRVVGVRVPPPPLPPAAHRAECARVFGSPRPLERLAIIAKATVPVLRADACLLLADLAAPPDTLRASRPGRAREPNRPR